MTYILHLAHGEFDQTKTFATAADAVAALDSPETGPGGAVLIDRMGETITEAELRRNAAHEGAREPLKMPDVRMP